MSFRNEDDFDSETYVKVNNRLQEFWGKHPTGRVHTGYAFHDGVLVMKAELFRDEKDERPAATGHSFLESLSGDKVGEYTETVAVGRALALMGFKIERSLASGEEMRRFGERQNARSEGKEEAPREPKIKPAASKTEAKQDKPPEPEPQKEQPKQISDAPEVPKTLKASRIFKPRPKDASKEGDK